MRRFMIAMTGVATLAIGTAACDGDGGSSTDATTTTTTTTTDTSTVTDTSATTDTGTTSTNTDTSGDTGTSTGPTDTSGGDTITSTGCTTLGASCTQLGEQSTDETLICGAADTLAPDTLTCLSVCESNAGCIAAMPACIEVGETGVGGCVETNCTSFFASATECASIGDDGGQCDPVDPSGSVSGGVCVPAGPAALGAACDGFADCAPGLLCLDEVCTLACSLEGNEAPCGSGEACQDFGLGAGVGFCLDFCAGFSAEAGVCGEGRGCRPTGADNGFCQEVGTQALGDNCDDEVNTCGEFLFCTGVDESAFSCHAMCDRTQGDFGDESCGASETCAAVDAVNGIGACFPGCTPFVAESANGCAVAGEKFCLPQDDGSHGLCLESGQQAVGEICTLGAGGSVLGVCEGDAICVAPQGSSTGTCQRVCETFAGGSDCGIDAVCSLFQVEWGTCTPITDRRAPFEACPTAGVPCDDGVNCFTVDDQGNNLCIAYCRPGEDDCAAGSVCELGFFEGDPIGLCLPE